MIGVSQFILNNRLVSGWPLSSSLSSNVTVIIDDESIANCPLRCLVWTTCHVCSSRPIQCAYCCPSHLVHDCIVNCIVISRPKISGFEYPRDCFVNGLVFLAWSRDLWAPCNKVFVSLVLFICFEITAALDKLWTMLPNIIYLWYICKETVICILGFRVWIKLIVTVVLSWVLRR